MIFGGRKRVKFLRFNIAILRKQDSFRLLSSTQTYRFKKRFNHTVFNLLNSSINIFLHTLTEIVLKFLNSGCSNQKLHFQEDPDLQQTKLRRPSFTFLTSYLSRNVVQLRFLAYRNIIQHCSINDWTVKSNSLVNSFFKF